MTICEPGGHGHSVSGWLSQDVMAWLKNYAKDKVDTNSFMQVAPMHPEVVYAMRSVWYAISTPERRPYADAASGWVRENGAFSLNCFGDACDLSIYPDSYNGENYVSVEFGCHNLDSADQQLTLLAGLAKICELAREAT